MSWEFDYKLRIELSHPTMDLSAIDFHIPDLRRIFAINAGDHTVMKSGAVRIAKLSVWTADLHEPEYLNSESTSLNDTLQPILYKLQEFSSLLDEIRSDGYIYLQLVVFPHEEHCVAVIPSDLLKLLGQLGLALDLEYWSRDDYEIKEP